MSSTHVMSALRCVALPLFCLALAACAETPPNPDLFAGFSRVRVESPTPDSSLISALATDADTLFVYDQGTSYVVVLDSAGTEVRRFIPTGVGAFRTLDRLAVLDDSTLIVTRSDLGRATVESIDRTTGELRKVWFETTENAEMAEILRHLSACVRRDADRPMILAMNELVFEGVGVTADAGEERLHFQTSFAGLREDGLDWPSSAGVRCGATMALFSGSTPGPVERTSTSVTFRSGIVLREARDYDGTLRMRVMVEDSESLLHGGVGAMRGDTLFVMNSTALAYPVVAEFVLEPAG